MSQLPHTCKAARSLPCTSTAARLMKLQAYAESSMRQYHPAMVDVIRSTLKQSMEEGTVQG